MAFALHQGRRAGRADAAGMSGTTSKRIKTVEEFYAHALAIEREAAERYAEFDAWFTKRGEPLLAGLCRTLAEMESQHARQLTRASRALELPDIGDGGYRWLPAGSPETPAREHFYRVTQPRQLLEIAFHAECNALAFFDWVGCTTSDDTVRTLAREMAAEEEQHVQWVRNALEYNLATVRAI